MLLILSGEGPSDLGACRRPIGRCQGEDFRQGPMSVLIDQLLEARLGYSLLQRTPDRVFYVSEFELGQRLQALKNQKHSMSLTGKKRGQETGYFFMNAWVFGQISAELEASENDLGIAVLFRDSDGTRHSRDGYWTEKWDSMEAGFLRAGHERGVPMLPRPTSEAWLLCGTDATHCTKWESLPGNQASPNHPKKKLAAFFGRSADDPASTEELCAWLTDIRYDADRATQMDSFQRFRGRFEQVLGAVLHPGA